MIKLLTLLILVVSYLDAQEAQTCECEKEKKKRYGYSYLAIGMQYTNYSQSFHSDTQDYSLSSVSSSPYYTTATLTRVNKDFGFEIYAASTLFASTSSEYLEKDNESSEHKLDMTLTDIALTIHYKPYNEFHRLTFGGRYTYEVLKRYNFSTPITTLGLVNNTISNLIENKIAALSLDIGYMYMSKIETGTTGFNYRLGANFGIPFFTATADTYETTEGFNLNTALGYKFTANAYFGYTIFDGFELGAYLDTLYQMRFDDIEDINQNGTLVSAKESIKLLANFGVMASWSF